MRFEYVHSECPPKVWIHHAVNSSTGQSSRKTRGLGEEEFRVVYIPELLLRI